VGLYYATIDVRTGRKFGIRSEDVGEVVMNVRFGSKKVDRIEMALATVKTEMDFITAMLKSLPL